MDPGKLRQPSQQEAQTVKVSSNGAFQTALLLKECSAKCYDKRTRRFAYDTWLEKGNILRSLSVEYEPDLLRKLKDAYENEAEVEDPMYMQCIDEDTVFVRVSYKSIAVLDARPANILKSILNRDNRMKFFSDSARFKFVANLKVGEKVTVQRVSSTGKKELVNDGGHVASIDELMVGQGIFFGVTLKCVDENNATSGPDPSEDSSKGPKEQRIYVTGNMLYNSDAKETCGAQASCMSDSSPQMCSTDNIDHSSTFESRNNRGPATPTSRPLDHNLDDSYAYPEFPEAQVCVPEASSDAYAYPEFPGPSVSASGASSGLYPRLEPSAPPQSYSSQPRERPTSPRVHAQASQPPAQPVESHPTQPIIRAQCSQPPACFIESPSTQQPRRRPDPRGQATASAAEKKRKGQVKIAMEMGYRRSEILEAFGSILHNGSGGAFPSVDDMIDALSEAQQLSSPTQANGSNAGDARLEPKGSTRAKPNGIFRRFLPFRSNSSRSAGSTKAKKAASDGQTGNANRDKGRRQEKHVDQIKKELDEACSERERQLEEVVEEMRKELDEARSRLSQYTACVICLDQRPSVIFTPCLHFVCCGSCASALDACPICRQRIHGAMKVYQ